MPSADAIKLASRIIEVLGMPDPSCHCEKCELKRAARDILKDPGVTVSVTANVSLVQPSGGAK